MTKEEFLKSLSDCYTRLAPTSHGVGVIAIRAIPKGTNPFIHCSKVDTIAVTEQELLGQDPAVLNLVKDMCAKQDGAYFVPVKGIDAIEKDYYINHSTTPNMATNDEGNTFFTIRDIAPGEELTSNYQTYDESGQDFES